jgi:hypothetical protein
MRRINNIKVAKEKGNEVNVFLADDAVLLAKPGMVDHIKAPTGDGAATYLSFLVEQKVPLYI